MDADPATSTDGRLRRGGETRRAVLKRAVEVASVQGLEGISIGQLAGDLSISKSGLFAHFGAKEELQLATIRAARRIYADAVVAPAMAVAPGLGRVWALTNAWLRYSQERVFPGGCFFANATHEFAARPGPVLDALTTANKEWTAVLEQTIEDARLMGDLVADAPSRQLAFELNAFYEAANLASLLGDDTGYDRARRAVQRRLEEVVSPDVTLPWSASEAAPPRD